MNWETEGDICTLFTLYIKYITDKLEVPLLSSQSENEAFIEVTTLMKEQVGCCLAHEILLGAL